MSKPSPNKPAAPNAGVPFQLNRDTHAPAAAGAVR